ncbi:hypothetical protein ACIBBE_24500 [Streptomyces sp. NPDC051644]|uniref:hypothetical protein n=1 Tax=Streptomyces sp. NPDC051644 TaxID=3365666 RepID=UPI00379667F2
MASADDDEMIYYGSVTFDTPIPLSAIADEHEALQVRPDLITLTYAGTGSGRSLVGIDTADQEDAWAWSNAWGSIHRTLEGLARRHGRVLQTNATFESDQRGRGILVVDEGNRLHDCQEGEDLQAHRVRACSCLSWEAPRVEATEHEQVSGPRAVPAGPFTDHVVICTEHGEVVCATSERGAYFHREAHIVGEHTASPLPLGPRPASEALPFGVRELIEDAAAELRRGRSYAPAGAVNHRDAAREYTRRAESELRAFDLGDTVAALLQFCVELRADFPQ